MKNIYQDSVRRSDQGVRVNRSQIMTDGWSSYAGLQHLGYYHQENVGAVWAGG